MNMKTFAILFRIGLLCCFAFSVTGPVNASFSPISFDGLHTWVIHPLNKTPDDSANIQQAINVAKTGDTIKLAPGVFNFGDFESVSVGKDLTIEGAWDNTHGIPLTIIQGGFTPIIIGRTTSTPIDKPETLTVNGHTVYHITQDFVGRFYFPFLYPPYFDTQTNTSLKPYDMNENWSAINVNVRQIIFQRPYFQAIYIGAMQGGSIERCRFISAYPGRMDFFGTNWHSMAIQLWNIQFSMGIASDYFALPDFVHGDDFMRGNLIVRDNVFESDDFAEIPEGAKDLSGHIVFVPYDENSTPPENDYKNYVVEDLYTNLQAFDMHPTNPPAMYWVRKGYNTSWSCISTDCQQVQVFAFHGQLMGIHTSGTQASMTVKDNIFHNQFLAMNLGPNGQWGQPFNVIIESNKITANMQSLDPFGVGGITIADQYGGSPGTANAVVKDNKIDIAYKYTGPGYTGGSWFYSGIDLEIMGKASVTGNTVKMNSESGIAFWGPNQNGVAQGNKITGNGDYAFLTLWSDGNKFIDNQVDHFMPTGAGAYDRYGYGVPLSPIPAARGLLFESNSNLVQSKGKPSSIDVIYDCGQDNQIQNMIVRPCPVPTANNLTSDSQRTVQPLRNPMFMKNVLPIK